MADQDVLLGSLNSGEISRLALARIDLAKLKIACESQLNWLPHVLGPTMFRPGTAMIAEVPGDANGWLGEFYFDETHKTLFVVTSAGMQFLVNDVFVTRVAVSAAVTNGNFDTDLSGWTNSDESGATSSWDNGYLSLVGTGVNFAFRDQEVTVTETGTEHALRVVIHHGTVSLTVGTSAGDGTYLDVSLLEGTYSLAFTPTGNFWIRLGADDAFAALVDSINVEAAGAVSIPVPWTDFDLIRYDQSQDVVFVACDGFQQRRIERRNTDSRSWGLALYLTSDGPFRLENQTSTQISPSDVHGSVTLTATRGVFQTGHIGALFQLVQQGETADATLGGANQFGDPIRVAGLSNTAGVGGGASQRVFAITITGTFVATVTLQRSIGAVGSWTDVKSWTTDTSESFDDTLDNQIIFYRLGIKTGNYTSGSAETTLSYVGASQTGVARITGITNTTSAVGDVLSQFGSTNPTAQWSESEWSDFRGWPSAVALHEGRLAWGTGISLDASVSDAFDSFDATTVGDSGPIDRTIATGGNDGIRWLISAQRLLGGNSTQIASIRASAFDEELTPTAFVARACSTKGAAKIRALKIDQNIVHVGRDGQRVFQLIFQLQQSDYTPTELTRLKQEMCAAGIVDVAVQRYPDTRLWFVLADGTCAVLTYDAEDDVEAWTPVATDGAIERVAVLPSSDEDDVYFIVARTILGATKRYVEKLAKRTECVGGVLNKTIDSHILYSGVATTTITGLSHLEGKQVVVWGDGNPIATTAAPKTVSGGQITGLSPAVANAVVGLPYTAQLKTGKLAFAAERGTPLEMQKRLSRLGLIMADVGWKGVRIGRDFTTMTGLPATYKGRPLGTNEVLTAYDVVPGSFNGGWDSDARACIQVQSPYSCTLMAMVLQLETNEPNPPDPPPSKS